MYHELLYTSTSKSLSHLLISHRANANNICLPVKHRLALCNSLNFSVFFVFNNVFNTEVSEYTQRTQRKDNLVVTTLFTGL